MENSQDHAHAVLFPVTSLIILAFLIAQVTVIVLPVPTYYWPFMDYPMYSVTRFENELVNDNLEVVGILSDGRERNVTHQELGLSFFKFNDWFVPRLRKNHDDQMIKQYVEQLRAMDNQAFQRVRIQAKPVRVSRTGIDDAPVQVFTVIDLRLPVGDR